MLRKLTLQNNQVLIETQKRFSQYVEPYPITKAQFDKLFRSKKSVGQGSYGAIKCVQNIYHQEYALKESKDNQQTYGLYRQVAIMKKFNHPNLLKFIGFYQIKQSSKLFILTQYCKYKSLKDFSPFLSSLSNQQKYTLAIQVFNGIYAMHRQNIMHRDLKPQNVLIDQKKRAKICDFGFCQYDDTDLKKSRKIGTPLYNSPQTQQGAYSIKCDIFSYGLIVYYIFSNGKHLFKKYQTHEQLKQTRRSHFKLKDNAYKQLNVDEYVKQLLRNTITQTQSKRYSTEQVGQYLQKIINQKSLSIKIINDQNEQTEYKKYIDNDQEKNKFKYIKDLNLGQKIVSQILRRNRQTKQQQRYQMNIQKIYRFLRDIIKLIDQFKKIIQSAQIKVTQKHIITFGCFIIFYLHLDNSFNMGRTLLKNRQAINIMNKNIKLKIQNSISINISLRNQLAVNIFKVSKYLRTHRYLIKPFDLFSAQFTQSIDHAKMFQNLPQQLLKFNYSADSLRVNKNKKKRQDNKQSKINKINEQISTNYSSYYESQSRQNSSPTKQGSKQGSGIQSEQQQNQYLYKLIQKNYKLRIDIKNFKYQFQQTLIKYRRQKSNQSKSEEIQKINHLIKLINKIEFITIN